MEIRTALVTGASSGIGRELSRQLAARGVEVVLLARRGDLLEALAAEIAAAGGRARAIPGDVSRPEELVALIQRADDEVGGLDLVVANAGVGTSRWAGKMRWEDCKPTIDVNVSGAVATLTAVLPRMAERKRGHLVGISSLAGSRGLPKSAIYSASKAFLSVFLESMRIDLRGTGVLVTDVRPGFVRTPLTHANQFKMPMMVEVADAVAQMIRGIEREETVISFPWPLAAAVRVGRVLPDAVYDRLLTRVQK